MSEGLDDIGATRLVDPRSGYNRLRYCAASDTPITALSAALPAASLLWLPQGSPWWTTRWYGTGAESSHYNYRVLEWPLKGVWLEALKGVITLGALTYASCPTGDGEYIATWREAKTITVTGGRYADYAKIDLSDDGGSVFQFDPQGALRMMIEIDLDSSATAALVIGRPVS